MKWIVLLLVLTGCAKEIECYNVLRITEIERSPITEIICDSFCCCNIDTLHTEYYDKGSYKVIIRYEVLP